MKGSKSIEVSEVSFEEIDVTGKSRLRSSKSSKFDQKSIELLSADSVKFLVSCFLLRDVDTDGKAKVFTLRNLMNVLENLNNLRENDDSLNNLFEDLRNFNDLFNSGVDWNVSLFNSIDDLNFSLNSIDDAFSVDELADFSNFFSDSFYGLLFDSGGCNLNDLLLDDWHFNEYLFDSVDRNDLFNDSLDDLVDLDELREDGLEFNNLDLLDDLLVDHLDGNDLGDFNKSLDDLFDNSLDDLDFSGHLRDKLGLLDILRNLNNLFLNNDLGLSVNSWNSDFD